MVSRMRAGFLAIVGGALLVSQANGHVYQEFPISRQYSRSLEFHNATYEDIEYAPFSYNAGGVKRTQDRAQELTDPEVLAEHGGGDLYPLYFAERAENGNFLESNEIAKRHGVCGDPRLGVTNETLTYTTANANWPVINSFESGQVIEMNIVIVYYHWGHMEFFICDTADLDDPDGVVDQECFHRYPLTRAPDDDNASRIDANFTGRYYMDPPCRMNETDQEFSTNVRDIYYSVKMRYVLPDIHCTHCVLQMHYLTGNRCKHIGYDEFDPPSWNSTCANSTQDWIDTDTNVCGVGAAYPEEFWACSDIAILRPDTQAPTHAPTQAPAHPRTHAPSESSMRVFPESSMDASTAAPTYAPTQAPTETPLGVEAPAGSDGDEAGDGGTVPASANSGVSGRKIIGPDSSFLVGATALALLLL